MITTHFDLEHGALCGEDQPDSSGMVATSIREDQVDCEACLSALGV